MSDEQHGVGRDGLLLEKAALFCHRPRRAAVMIDHYRGDALRHEVRRLANRGIRIPQTALSTGPIVRVRVDVDKPGRDVFAGCVDDACGLGVSERSHRHNPPATHADIGRKPGIARAVQDPRTADQKVKCRGRLLRHRQAGNAEGND
jgi:hypothetical protein